jgi:ABC-type multidrug transport system ATPase subunit
VYSTVSNALSQGLHSSFLTRVIHNCKQHRKSTSITCNCLQNGAGKSTTLHMLVGMVPVTSGRAYVDGLDVSCQMSQVRRGLGVCPQHDILYADMTVCEHLRLFAAIKVRDVYQV